MIIIILCIKPFTLSKINVSSSFKLTLKIGIAITIILCERTQNNRNCKSLVENLRKYWQIKESKPWLSVTTYLGYLLSLQKKLSQFYNVWDFSGLKIFPCLPLPLNSITIKSKKRREEHSLESSHSVLITWYWEALWESSEQECWISDVQLSY